MLWDSYKLLRMKSWTVQSRLPPHGNKMRQRTTQVSLILTFGHKRTPLQKRPKMMQIQGGQKFSHTLEQTNVGAESHLYAEMKTQWIMSLEKKNWRKTRGGWNSSGGITSGECWVVSRREREKMIFFPWREWRKVWVGSLCGEKLLEKENFELLF